ncbi:MAG: DNA-methyltransferase [Fidelibacterota bacterium]
MVGTDKTSLNPLFTNPLETSPGLTVDDLNRYLSAIRKTHELSSEIEILEEGVFLGDALDGLKRLPDESIDLILTAPPESPWRDIGTQGKRMTIQEYFQWSNRWLRESHRVLKKTGSMYLLCGWRFSGMYHSILSDYFKVQTRITWRNKKIKGREKLKSWENELGDIWFATKTNAFIFNNEISENESISENFKEVRNMSNLWMEYYHSPDKKYRYEIPNLLLRKIMDVSSYKLSWVVDPFMRQGSVGVAVKNLGRRFIGFETDKDSLLLAMKRIDNA